MTDQNTVNSISPYITVKGASDAIEFYCGAMGAEELFRLCDPADGRIGHAELRFGSAILMLSDEYPDFGALRPAAFGGSPVKLYISVDDVDAVFAAALARGAVEIRGVRDEFHGSRSGVLTDPYGHTWHIDTKIEDVSPQEMQQRWNDAGTE